MTNGGNMHEDYNYDDDDHDYDDAKDPYKHYFKFDPAAWDAWGKWLYDALNDIVEFSPNVWYTPVHIPGFSYKSLPVNSYFSNTGKDKNFQYLGNNYDGVKVWKTKYFIKDEINILYKQHIKANAVHFLQQPQYYRSMFDILN